MGLTNPLIFGPISGCVSHCHGMFPCPSVSDQNRELEVPGQAWYLKQNPDTVVG